MGNFQSISKVTFEELQKIIEYNNEEIIINTLKADDQKCIIYNTIKANKEEETINNLIKKNKNRKIIIYGKNYNDETLYKKYTQLKNLGFKNIFIYPGGMFEWLCLKEIYGGDLFKTSGHEEDLLKYK